MTGAAIVLQATGLTKTFESDGAPVRALRGVDFAMASGEFVAVSTGLRQVDAAQPGRRARHTDRRRDRRGGRAGGQGRERAGPDATRPHRHRLPVLQPARGHDRAGERDAAGGHRRGRAPPGRDPPATCSTCWAWPTRPGRAGVLSGGQRQRLAIARALANEPTVVLADEPTGALDSEGGQEVLELFRRLHAGGQAILLVTHDQGVAEAGDRIVRMRDGRVESSSPPAWPWRHRAATTPPRPSRWRGRHAVSATAPAGADPAGRRDRHHRGAARRGDGHSAGRHGRPAPVAAALVGAPLTAVAWAALSWDGERLQAVRISVAVVWAVVGTLLAIRRPQEPSAWWCWPSPWPAR